MAADASHPGLAPSVFDAVVVRHVIWTIADPHAALSRWAGLLSGEGQLVLIEGRWGEPSEEQAPDRYLPWPTGPTASQLIGALEPLFEHIEHHPLSNDPALWGKAVSDERYALIARHRSIS
jgi:SAM-dependent methyltransferase